MKPDPDEEVTKPAEPESLATLAREWEQEFAIPNSERPTRNMKAVKVPG